MWRASNPVRRRSNSIAFSSRNSAPGSSKSQAAHDHESAQAGMSGSMSGNIGYPTSRRRIHFTNALSNARVNVVF
jgi:hypothetical protein